MLQSHSLYFLLIFIAALLLELRHPYHVRRYLCVASASFVCFVTALFVEKLFVPCALFPVLCAAFYGISFIRIRKDVQKKRREYAVALADIPRNGKGAVYTMGKVVIAHGAESDDIKRGQVIYIDDE